MQIGKITNDKQPILFSAPSSCF